MNLSLRALRDSYPIFNGKSTTQKLARKIEKMINFLLCSDKIPSGMVLMTGGGIIIPAESALKQGDIVKIRIPEIGELTNVAKIV